MNIRFLDDKNSKDFLRGIIAAECTVPFIGSGFTCGEKSRNKLVPNGTEWMNIMRKQITSSPVIEKPTSSELEHYKFQELSDIYLQDEIVSLGTIKKTLDEYFSNVKICNPAKTAFLGINWRYLYTLNIDDAIETALNGVKVLPYEPFSNYRDRTCVYKMHGDVSSALKAKDRNDLKLIFGRSDYIKSLRRNEHLIQALTNDLIESNLIFIGCSLTEELDILFALSDYSANNEKQSAKRIYITDTEPTDYTNKKKLKDYGITDIIVCNYESFYLTYVEIYRDIISNSQTESAFLIERISPPPFDVKKFFQYFVQSEWMGGNPGQLPIKRTIEEKILKAIETQPVVAVKGGRFSGRTSILYSVLNMSSTKKLFFVSSNQSLTNKELDELLTKKDSLILFDTESLTWQQIRYICTKTESILDSNASIVIGVNRWDVSAVHKLELDESIFDVRDKFDRNEITQINKIFDSIGIERWKNKDRLLDNIYHAANTAVITSLLSSKSALQNKIEERVNRISSAGIPNHEFSLIYCLAARQRIFSIHYRAIIKKSGYYSTCDDFVDSFIKKWEPFIEKIDTNLVSSKSSHSQSEIVSNSQAWIYFALRLISSKIGHEETTNKIVYTISALKNLDDQYHELIMFDTLNSVFPSNSSSNVLSARYLISNIYEKLAPLLSSEPDYWLQRAKSIYHNHESNGVDDVLVAIGYATKALKESDKRVTINARLTKANLYGLLCQLDGYNTEEYIFNAIDIPESVLNSRKTITSI